MLPFIATDLDKIIRNFMERCIKGSVIESASSVSDLMKIDLQKNKLDNKKLALVSIAEHELNKLKYVSCKAISCRRFEFREGCRMLLVRLLEKIIESSPMKYSIARTMTCLDPRYVAKHGAGSKLKLKFFFEVLVTLKRVHEDEVVVLNRTYSDVLKDVVGGRGISYLTIML